MTPFDLDRARAGEPICTRDGKPGTFDRLSYGIFYVIVDGVRSARFLDGRVRQDSDDIMMADASQPLADPPAPAPISPYLGVVPSGPLPNEPGLGKRLLLGKWVSLPDPSAPAPAGLLSLEEAEAIGRHADWSLAVRDALLGAQRAALDAAADEAARAWPSGAEIAIRRLKEQVGR